MDASKETLEKLLKKQHAAHHKQAQLWWLAIIVISVLTLCMVLMDISSAILQHTKYIRYSNFFIENRILRIGLVSAILLLCIYFFDSSSRARKTSLQLTKELAEKNQIIEQRNRELLKLKEISDRLVGNLDMQEGLDMLLSMALEITGAETASILLMDQELGLLDYMSARTVSVNGTCTDLSHIKRGLAEWVAKNSKPILVNSESDEPEISALLGTRGVAPTMIAPIVVGGKTLGVLSIVRGKTDEPFNQNDIQAICELTDRAGLAIEKMHLYRKLREQVVCLRSALRDLKRAQAGLIQSEKLASIGQLVAGMAHEINNPLLVILGRAEMLLVDMDPDNPTAKDLEIIKSETQRIANLVRNLLGFSRTNHPGMLNPVNINELIERTLELVQTQGSITIVKRLTEDLPMIYADASEIQQIYMNIAINAVQAMKEKGGKLIVETSQDDAGFVVAKFADTGPGIKPEHLSKIFDPFFTTKPEFEGTGLGLSVSKSLAEKYGGKIEVETRVKQGATFIVKLPAIQEQLQELPKVA